MWKRFAAHIDEASWRYGRERLPGIVIPERRTRAGAVIWWSSAEPLATAGYRVSVNFF